LIEKGLENEQIQVYGDSALVIQQMQGLKNIGNGFYVEQAVKCKELVKRFTNIRFQWIPREMNAEADSLADMRKRKQPSHSSRNIVMSKKGQRRNSGCVNIAA